MTWVLQMRNLRIETCPVQCHTGNQEQNWHQTQFCPIPRSWASMWKHHPNLNCLKLWNEMHSVHFLSFSVWDVKYSSSSLTMFHTAVGSQYHSENTCRKVLNFPKQDNSHPPWRACMAVIKLPSSSTDCLPGPLAEITPSWDVLWDAELWTRQTILRFQAATGSSVCPETRRTRRTALSLRMWVTRDCSLLFRKNPKSSHPERLSVHWGAAPLQHWKWRGCEHFITQGWTRSCRAQGCYLPEIQLRDS